MATAGNNVAIYIAGYNLSPFFNSAEDTDAVAKLEDTHFGDGRKKSAPGIGEGSVKAAGDYDGSLGAVQEALKASLGNVVGEPGTLGYYGDSFGLAATLWKNFTGKHSEKAAVGGKVVTDAELITSSSGLADGVWLHALSAVTATGTGTAFDGGAATATGWRATLHCTARSGTTPTLVVKLQDSADNATFADVATFTTLSAAGGLYLASAAGATLRRYVRVIWTVTGTSPSFTFAAAVARQT